ncbi:MAG: exo-alpha-sialidase [Chloroflexi bacterium]|nr:exo-alpha-sialidase [Chloroflexota bacterium]
MQPHKLDHIASEIWTHPGVTLCAPRVEHNHATAGGAALLSDGRVLAMYSGGPQSPHRSEAGDFTIYARESKSQDLLADGWGPERPAIHHAECKSVNPALLSAADGTLWVFYLGFYRSVWIEGEPDMSQTRSDVWCARSTDDGRTWTSPRIIFPGYCGATRGAIQLAGGQIAVPISYTVPNPGRIVSACVVSTDNGRSWQIGDAIDIGQHGDHAGAVEPTIVELRDGRVWMLIRTNLGQFWEAFSADYGMSWTTPKPTALRSPSAPGYLLRLSSGRIAFMWNNTMDRAEKLEGVGAERIDGAQLNMSLRDTLSMALSADDGLTWTAPVELARSIQLSYPGLLEISPGTILCRCQWVQPGWNNLKPIYFTVEEQILLDAQKG